MIRKTNFYLLILLFATACSSVPKYPQNACKIFGQKYLWYKSAKKSSDTYGAPIHIILAFVNKNPDLKDGQNLREINYSK